MYAHIVPQYFLKKWTNSNGKYSVYVFDKNYNNYLSNGKNIGDIFGQKNFYYLPLFLENEYSDIRNGNKMYLVDVYKQCFPDFFKNTDLLLTDYHFEDKGRTINDELTYYFVYNYNSPNNKIKVFDKNNFLVSINKIKKIIEEKWNGYKCSNENYLQKLESKSEPIHSNIIKALSKNQINDINNLHDGIALIISLQQSRMPDDKLFEKSVNKILNYINNNLEEFGLPDTSIKYDCIDYKHLCLIQLLKTYSDELKDDNCEKSSVFLTLKKNYENALFIYIKSIKSHKFVIGDHPLVYDNVNHFIALPLSPDYCVIVVKSETHIDDFIIQANKELINYINWLEYDQAKNKIISFDKRFVSKTRMLDFNWFQKQLKKHGITF